jgi:capsule polysaccharide export protein KpsC/LpsZ
MQAYRAQFPEGRWLKWREENIHDLIDECDAVFLVNSGVGFEALLHAKPIVMFGRAEYDCVAIRATIDEIDAAWAACQSSDPDLRARQYGQFFDWFTTEYAVDLSREDVRDRQLQRLVQEFLAIARGTSARTPAHALGGADA